MASHALTALVSLVAGFLISLAVSPSTWSCGSKSATGSSSSTTTTNQQQHSLDDDDVRGRGGFVAKTTGLHTPLNKYRQPTVEYRIPPKQTPTGGIKNRKTYVITGGAGFIGSQLGYKLWKDGHEVILIDNMQGGYRDNLVNAEGEKFGIFVLADVRDIAIRPYLQKADVVFHFAALTALPVCQSNPVDTIEVNVGGTANVLEAVRLSSKESGVKRVVFASTSATYERNTEAQLSEDLTIDPKLLYSLSKLQSEQLISAYQHVYQDIDIVSLRFFNVYGPHQDFRRQSPPLTSYIVRELLNKRTPVLHSTGKQERDYVYVDDLLRLVILAANKPEAANQVFNVASGEAVSVNQIYWHVATAMNLTEGGEPDYKPASNFWKRYPVLFDGGHKIRPEILDKEVNKYTLGSNKKAKDLLGWQPEVSMKEGLQRMVQFVKDHQRTAQTQTKSGNW